MKKWLAGLAVFALLLGIAGVGAVQYVTQKPAKSAILELLTRRRLLPPPMGTTALGFRNAPIPDSFGPVGPQPIAGPVCYDTDGRPLSREEATEGGSCGVTLRTVRVFGAVDLASALSAARAGDEILLAPSDYDFGGGATGIRLSGAGTALAPIRVRAEQLGAARLRLATVEGFKVAEPYWVFENLDIDGTCQSDNDCEHAFHIVGRAANTIVRNNRIRNFNAAIKINGENGAAPDDTLIERNLIFNGAPRETTRPVTPVDAVAADRLHLVANVIADFAKNGGDRTSYGAFAKGGGTGALFERNLVMCEWRHRGGNRVGLSMGGGGTGEGLCRGGACSFEQQDGTIRANVIANCADAGVYLLRAPGSRVENNLLRATRGIEARFAETQARVVNNIIDGRLIGWKGAAFDEAANISSGLRAAFLGRVSDGVLADPVRGNFSFRDAARRGVAIAGRARDFCGTRFTGEAPPIGPIEQRGASCAGAIKGLR